MESALPFLGEDQEITPNEASRVLGLSRPLVVRRMEIGELPFLCVGKHRRMKLKDVLSLKDGLDRQQVAVDGLAGQTERLMATYDFCCAPGLTGGCRWTKPIGPGFIAALAPDQP